MVKCRGLSLCHLVSFAYGITQLSVSWAVALLILLRTMAGSASVTLFIMSSVSSCPVSGKGYRERMSMGLASSFPGSHRIS